MNLSEYGGLYRQFKNLENDRTTQNPKPWDTQLSTGLLSGILLLVIDRVAQIDNFRLIGSTITQGKTQVVKIAAASYKNQGALHHNCLGRCLHNRTTITADHAQSPAYLAPPTSPSARSGAWSCASFTKYTHLLDFGTVQLAMCLDLASCFMYPLIALSTQYRLKFSQVSRLHEASSYNLSGHRIQGTMLGLTSCPHQGLRLRPAVALYRLAAGPGIRSLLLNACIHVYNIGWVQKGRNRTYHILRVTYTIHIECCRQCRVLCYLMHSSARPKIRAVYCVKINDRPAWLITVSVAIGMLESTVAGIR